jgi:hypothetical protein
MTVTEPPTDQEKLMNSTSDKDRSDQQGPAAGKSAQMRDLMGAAADDGTKMWVVDPKASPAGAPAVPGGDAEERRGTRGEREELFGFHPDILRQAGRAPRTLRRANSGAGTTPSA